ncbi:hypothetical protein TVAG_000810 [Trichomonas vaginalis G3]|uniref:Uncharacterized protein n=1 Tax=Trichomonas vaginalis (strain ATCC PRA-98 / G3) TaxID=412133 RepID=A2EHV7_TRIV3|nr:BioY family protein domain-containing protein [Trichomonas vaginalis G3]EAY07797.1 hypothetical protein TVAG_000810 [Trichomonas vaginalis G3]KAI5542929.1 BioY family protein domain-containing protein [Trichomonas vaginalis G3]|eukprot:XP_001320020.1 hypothetical protein [Trichomonas vaginalis G3]
MSAYTEVYKNLVQKGLVDEAYPVDGLCVQLPNGWYGIHAIIDNYANQLKEIGYDEEMVPSVATNTIYSKVPQELQGNVVENVFKITHTGLHKLDDPYFMANRPDLILPQIEMNNARSYRNLPILRIAGGFRYNNLTATNKYALITDIEQPAKDVVGIVFSEQDYLAEVKRDLDILYKILREDCKLTTFSVRRHHSIVVFAIFPNGQVLEIATVRLYYQSLSEALDFKVLGPDGKFQFPHIFNINIGSRAFAASVVAHSTADRIVLPKALMRAHGVAYNFPVDLKTVRVDLINKDFTQERFNRQLEQGLVFALVKADNGVKVITESGETVVAEAELEQKLTEILDAREKKIEEQSNAAYAKLYSENISFVDSEDAKLEEGKVILGLVMKEQDNISVPEEKKYAVAVPLVELHH